MDDHSSKTVTQTTSAIATITDTPSKKRTRDENDTAEEDQRPAKRAFTIHEFGDIITVLVGPEEKFFMLHQEAICAKSKFFKAACSTRWLEGQERVVRLPELTAALFKTYCTWIYTDDFEIPLLPLAIERGQSLAEQASLVDLYLLGDRLDDIQLRDRAIVMLLRSSHERIHLFGAPLLEYIYDATARGSLLRKVVVDLTVSRCSREDFARDVRTDPTEYVQEVAVAALWAVMLLTPEKAAENASRFKELQESN